MADKKQRENNIVFSVPVPVLQATTLFLSNSKEKREYLHHPAIVADHYVATDAHKIMVYHVGPSSAFNIVIPADLIARVVKNVPAIQREHATAEITYDYGKEYINIKVPLYGGDIVDGQSAISMRYPDWSRAVARKYSGDDENYKAMPTFNWSFLYACQRAWKIMGAKDDTSPNEPTCGIISPGVVNGPYLVIPECKVPSWADKVRMFVMPRMYKQKEWIDDV